MPSDKIKVKIGPNEYTIDFPNNAQLIDIEASRIRMTGGTVKDMIQGNTAAMSAYITVEAIATFEILVPKLKTDLNCKSLLNLNPQQSQSFLKAYEKYYEWMDQWRVFLNQDIEEKKS